MTSYFVFSPDLLLDPSPDDSNLFLESAKSDILQSALIELRSSGIALKVSMACVGLFGRNVSGRGRNTNLTKVKYW